MNAQRAYPSRIRREPDWQDRQDPVVYSGNLEDAPVHTELIRRFERDGYLVMPQLFNSEEIAVFRRELDRIREAPEVKSSEKTVMEPESRSVRSVFYIHRDNELFSRVARDKRIAGVARHILGGDLYIHQSRLNFKPGFTGKEFYWHSDFETWHIEDGMPNMRALSCSILLTENSSCNGPLMLIPGSHRHFIHCVGQTPENHYQQSLKKQEYGVPDRDSLSELVDRYGIDTATGPAGTVVFFDCNIMHGSNGNITPSPRSNLFFVYNHVDNALRSSLREHAPRPNFIAERERITRLDIQPERYL